MAQEDVFKKIVSHCKEYGFVFPSSEIYDGLAAVYDYGQNGVELKNNIKQYWWQSMVLLHENIVGLDAAIFMHPTVWKASGHVDAFNDPLIYNFFLYYLALSSFCCFDHFAFFFFFFVFSSSSSSPLWFSFFDEGSVFSLNFLFFFSP